MIVTTGQPLARMISALSMAVNRSVVARTSGSAGHRFSGTADA
jgi:hypothetical protein